MAVTKCCHCFITAALFALGLNERLLPRRHGGRREAPGLGFLFQFVQFLAQVAVGFLEVENFLAEILEIIDRFSGSAQVGKGAGRGGLLAAVGRGGGEGFEHGNGLGVAQRAEGAKDGKLGGVGSSPAGRGGSFCCWTTKAHRSSTGTWSSFMTPNATWL